MRSNTLKLAKTALLSLSSLGVLFPALAMTLGGVAQSSDDDSSANDATEEEATAGVAAGAQAAAPAAPAVLHPWTAVASTGVVDEAALTLYEVNEARIGFRTGSTATGIKVRYNVTNTFDNNSVNPNVPGWTTLELGAMAPGISSVMAQLFRVKPCTGTREPACRARNSNQAPGSAGVCKICTFSSAFTDFANYLYYVEVELQRTTPGVNPQAHTLRIF